MGCATARLQVSYTGSNAGFWSYEWGKHGTCALPLLPTQQDYFNAAISLNNKYEPNQALASSNIALAAAPTLPASRLQQALSGVWGVPPLVSCTKK